STPGNPSSFGVRLTNTASATPGGKFAVIQVTDPQSQGSPAFVTVLANVAPAGSAPIPIPDPAGLAFIATLGAASPAAQPVTVNTTSASSIAYFVSTETDDGGKWLTATAGASTTSQNAPAQVTVSVAQASLKAGVYHGTVNIAIGA